MFTKEQKEQNLKNMKEAFFPEKEINKRARNFVVVDNNYGEKDVEIFKTISCIKYAIFGEEVAKTGTPHLQGYVQLHNPKTIRAFQKILVKSGLKVAVKIAKGNWHHNNNYSRGIDQPHKEPNEVVHEWGIPKKQGQRTDIESMCQSIREGKDNTFLQESHLSTYAKYYKFADVYRRNYQKKQMKQLLCKKYKDAKLRDWQQKALDDLEKQTDRQITWYVDPEGNKGKTFLARYLSTQKNAFYVRGGKIRDIAYAFDEYNQKYVIFDFTKSQEEYVNYSAIECFKDGELFSSKYESNRKMFDPCKVICFSNFYPDTSQLIEDRWDIHEL